MSEKKVGKRLLTWVLVLVMTLSLLPLNVLADEIPLDEPTGEEAMIETGDATFDEPELAAYQNRKSTTKDAQFYYLKSPNSNPTTIYLWLISLTASKELSILLLKLYNDGAIGISSSNLGLRVRKLD